MKIGELDFAVWATFSIALLTIFRPIMRAIAAVLIGKVLKPELAKIALPLVLKPNKPASKNLTKLR